MKVLFTTNNKSKKDFYETGFKMHNNDINFVSINDPSLSDKVKFEVTNDGEVINDKDLDMVMVSVNESLYIDGLTDDKQPGVNYKYDYIKGEDGSITKSLLNDNDMVSKYQGIVEGLGGMANAKFIDNVTISYKGNVIKNFDVEKSAVFTSNASKVIKKGQPLNSITLIPEFGDIHYSECDDAEEELLFETRDQKVLKKIAKEVSDIELFNINDNTNDNNNSTNDFLGNEVSNN